MSYYIIPSNSHKLYVEPTTTTPKPIVPYLSPSLHFYYTQTHHQLNELTLCNEKMLAEAIQLVNSYEYLFTNVSGSQLSVSKLPYKSGVFYDILEIKYNLNLWDPLASSIRSLHVSPYHEESIDCIQMLREHLPEDIHLGLTESNFSLENEYELFDFIYYDTDINNTGSSFVQALAILFRHLSLHGTIVIHIHNIFDKIIVDGLFLLSSVFHQVYICKPSSNNIATFNKYLVCKDFHCNDFPYRSLTHTKLTENLFVNGLFPTHVPCYFRNKLDEINIIIGQQQLESLEMVLSIYRNKNKHDKIESVKKSNIQKCILWCEKYRIPYNRFSGRVNMFLPIATNEPEHQNAALPAEVV